MSKKVGGYIHAMSDTAGLIIIFSKACIFVKL